MKSLAVIVSGGSANQFIQVMTFLMAAVHSDIKVSVLFRDESVFRLKAGEINTLDFTGRFAADRAGVEKRLKQLELTDLYKLCRDIKASGDVRYYACSSSLAIAGLKQEDLIPEVDGVRGLPSFLTEEASAADKVLTF